MNKYETPKHFSRHELSEAYFKRLCKIAESIRNNNTFCNEIIILLPERYLSIEKEIIKELFEDGFSINYKNNNIKNSISVEIYGVTIHFTSKDTININ